jgi:hypothetical protein
MNDSSDSAVGRRIAGRSSGTALPCAAIRGAFSVDNATKAVLFASLVNIFAAECRPNRANAVQNIALLSGAAQTAFGCAT